MYRSYRKECKTDDIEAQISALISEINASDFDICISQDEISDKRVIEALKKENEDLKQFIAVETEKSKKLMEEKCRLSEQIQEEKRTISCFEEFMKEGLFSGEEVLDATEEKYYKLEVLHRKICRLIKKFSRRYLAEDPSPPSTPNLSTEVESTVSHKSLFDILRLLISELNPEESVESDRQLKIDDTINERHIQFLLHANIIKISEENPGFIELQCTHCSDVEH